MNISPARESILKKIRKALTQSTPLPFPQSEGNSSVFQPSQQELEVQFAEQFSKLQGKFVFCLNRQELAAQLQQVIAHNKWDKIYCREDVLRTDLAASGFNQFTHPDVASCDAAITSCEWLIARTGSIVMSAGQQSGRTVSVYAPVHICIAYASQLVYELKDGLQQAKEKYGANLPSLITFATGPSRTADIEKTLVVGVHGPKEVYVFLVDQ
ncbi:LUD domain-containing protein [Pseudoflavitalea sp. X16]|uniref:LutC/YkgG family protein n=1 Tax=Paraflavitalea devenefica TaxID=2716334 RepID=UPI00141E544F|nr:LUD domain-containing protein [Paraflavitalea devenefica]NII24926.1 LUD domain-containing protein [Paraflavitalea devenefica]